MLSALTRAKLGCLGIVMASSALMGANCGAESEPPDLPTIENTNKLQIGLVLSLSGVSQGIGEESQKGAMVAAQQLNALGGILGSQIELRIEDDNSEPSVTREKIKQLMGEGVLVGVGLTTSAGAEAVRDLTQDGGILYISPSASSVSLSPAPEDLTAGKVPLLRTTPADDSLAKAIGFVIAGQGRGEGGQQGEKCSGVTIIHTDDIYGTPIANEVKGKVLDLAILLYGGSSGRDLRAITASGATSQTYSDIAKAVITDALNAPAATESDIPCQVVVAPSKIAANYMLGFTEQAATYGNNAMVKRFVTIGADLHQEAYLRDSRVNPADPSSATTAEGVYVVAASAPTDQRHQVFVNLLKAYYPDVTVASHYSATAYDAMVTLALAIQASKTTTDLARLRAALLDITSLGNPNDRLGNDDVITALTYVQNGVKLNFEGASGTIDFNSQSGDVTSQFTLWRIASGEFVRAYSTTEM